MTLRVAFQMDPLESVDIDADTTFAIAEAAQERGAKIWTYEPKHLSCMNGTVTARARPSRVQRRKENPGIFRTVETIDLATDVDVIVMRQDPPFDMSYITACHILECISDRTLVVNDPAFVRNGPEKIFPIHFPEIIPPTLISRDPEALQNFRRQYRDIILKPLYGNGGAGIFKVSLADPNFKPLIETFLAQSKEPFIAQAFLPEVINGDKRIILIDGEPIGAINRVPQKGETRSNLHVGGLAEPAELTENDKKICERIGPTLKENGQILVGIDVIGDKMTEVNNTSPTGIQELKRFSGIDVAVLFWDVIERKLSDKQLQISYFDEMG